ncbi:MAG: DUF47 family protein [Deltaproteobacteria bacterium]|nr:DUF47 family protein [Deltaproteobacteria bacterium]MBW1993440.1 DUF47 family protein [Deltaproteobacteria bacterium]MBW2153321.1 DUF47 family protein [Deltaproteobacteria bacterium]
MLSALKKRICADKDSFYEMLTNQTRKTFEGLEALSVFVENASRENAERVRQCEREADHLWNILVQALGRSFVTPLDREDIYNLSRAIDDVVDYAYTTVQEMEMHEIHRHLSNAVDRGDEAANIISSIVMKHT